MAREWGFYGRRGEQRDVQEIMDRGRWFFCQISGRRRIGKTTLITRALGERAARVLYVAVPDSDTHGVLQSARDAMEDYGVDSARFPAPSNLKELAQTISRLCREGYIVVLDEFQYFHRKALFDFCSFLQTEVDRLNEEARSVRGGLFVVGSIHTEMMAILEDRSSPLFNRVTDRLEIRHLDHAALIEMFQAHGIADPHHILFLWTLFEGVPKFYRDCFEQGIFEPRPDYAAATVRRIFMEGSSPLRNEAETWFLKELRGRYDAILKLIAQQPGISQGELRARHQELDSTSKDKQFGGYLKALIERFQMIERRQPVFALAEGRKGRYYLRDNFLQAWLGALERQVRASRIQPVETVMPRATEALKTVEGFAFEKFVSQLLEELSRLGRGPIALTELVRGYWDRPDRSRHVEIDIVALDEERREALFGSCKRSETKHDDAGIAGFQSHVESFLREKRGRRLEGWKLRRALFSPTMADSRRRRLSERGFEVYSMPDLWQMLGAKSR